MRLPSIATTPIRNNAGVGEDWRAQKKYATDRLPKLGSALSSCDVRITAHRDRMRYHERRTALHKERMDAIETQMKKLEHMVDTERERLEIAEDMIATTEEFKRRTDEARKRLRLLVHLDKES